MAGIERPFGLLHCRFGNDSLPLLINSCSKFWNLTLNSRNANILNDGNPHLNKMRTGASASNFKKKTVEIKYVEYNDKTEKTVLNFELMVHFL